MAYAPIAVNEPTSSLSVNMSVYPCGEIEHRHRHSASGFETCENVRLNSERKDSDSSSDETLSLGLPEVQILDEIIDQDYFEEAGCFPKNRTPDNDIQRHERLVIGTFVDPHILPGFMYRVRPLNSTRTMFKGQPLLLQSIGLGYGKRITFASDRRNENDNYFWSDSYPDGYGFSIHVINTGEKFTICDANHLAIGTCEVIEVEEGQVEIEDEETIGDDGRVTKHVQVELLCNVEWYDDFENDNYQPCRVLGVAVVVSRKGAAAQVTRLIGVSVANHRRLSLEPGVDDKVRRTRVDGAPLGDVPVSYTISGLESYEMPVIGTYVDPRIVPGFCYKIRPVHGKRALFQGRALRLLSIGAGYGKRITLESNQRNVNDNYFWSDSYSDGLGFSIQVVFAGMQFAIVDPNGGHIGRAKVLKADAPQVEESHEVYRDGTVRKRVRVDLTCLVTFDPDEDVRTLRVSGMAVVQNPAGPCNLAHVCSIENVGIASQLYVMFMHRFASLTFRPVDNFGK